MNSKRIQLFALAAVAALTVALAACGDDDDDDTDTETDEVEATEEAEATQEAEQTEEPAQEASGSGTEVTIEGFAFNPADLQVNVGDTVTWTNLDSAGHTVTEDSGAFDSGNMPTDATFEFTFQSAGEFTYHCEFHPGMTGTISVGEGAQSPAQDGESPPASELDLGY